MDKRLFEKVVDTKTITHEEWVELRKTGIGGSDAGAVVGVNPYSSRYYVYHEKKGLVHGFEGNDKTRLGTDLEEYVAKRFEEATGKKVRKLNYMLRSKAHPCMIADVDRLVVGEEAGLECKTTTNNDRYDFEAGEYPAYWNCQANHYMAVTGLNKWYIAVLNLMTGVVSVIVVERHESEISALIALEEDFWYNYVEKGVVPLPNGDDKCEDILKEKYPTADDDDEDGEPIDLMAYDKELRELGDIKDKIGELEKRKKELEQILKEVLGTAPAGEFGDYRITYKNQSSNRVDTKRLKAELPEVYERYVNVSETRVFRFNNKNKKGDLEQ